MQLRGVLLWNTCIAHFQVAIGLPSFQRHVKLATHSVHLLIATTTAQMEATLCSIIFMFIALQWLCVAFYFGCFKYKVSLNSNFLPEQKMVREVHFICALFQKCAIELVSAGKMGSCCVSWRRIQKKCLSMRAAVWVSVWWSIKSKGISCMTGVSKAISGCGICGISCISKMLKMDPEPALGFRKHYVCMNW